MAGRADRAGWHRWSLVAARALAREPLSRAQARPPEPLWETGTFSILGFDPADRRSRRRGAVARVLGRQRRAVGRCRRRASRRRRRSSTSATVRRRSRCCARPDRPTRSSSRSGTRIPIRCRTTWTKQGRQFAVMNLKGEYAAFTGPKASDVGGPQGRQVLHGAGQHPRRAGGRGQHGRGASRTTTGHLSQRLVAALEGGQAGGGDTRGQQSAALVIVKKNCGVWLHNDTVLRLQVDDNPEPIAELRRLVEKWNERRPRVVSPECRTLTPLSPWSERRRARVKRRRERCSIPSRIRASPLDDPSGPTSSERTSYVPSD